MSQRQAFRHARLALLLGALCLQDPVRAQDDAARAQLGQKIRLTATLIADSPTAQRIVASGNAQAMAHLDEGRLHHAIAQDLLARGDLAGARRSVDEALRHLGHARRLVPDATVRQAAARQRHEDLLASTTRLVDALQRRTASSEADTTDLTGAIGLVDSARRLAADGRLDEANEMLARAERHALDSMMRTLRTRTIDYTARFATPAEEFQYELARQQGFADLVPLALRELHPGAQAITLAERYAQAGQTLRAQALQHFNAGDTPQALARIRESTQSLQRALLAAGLVSPPATGTPP